MLLEGRAAIAGHRDAVEDAVEDIEVVSFVDAMFIRGDLAHVVGTNERDHASFALPMANSLMAALAATGGLCHWMGMLFGSSMEAMALARRRMEAKP